MWNRRCWLVMSLGIGGLPVRIVFTHTHIMYTLISHTHTLMHTPSLSHTHTNAHALSLTHTHTNATPSLSHTFNLSLAHSHTHASLTATGTTELVPVQVITIESEEEEEEGSGLTTPITTPTQPSERPRAHITDFTNLTNTESFYAYRYLNSSGECCQMILTRTVTSFPVSCCVVNPRRACAARVTVVVLCVSE